VTGRPRKVNVIHYYSKSKPEKVKLLHIFCR